MVREFASSMSYNSEGKLEILSYLLNYSHTSGVADHTPCYIYSYNVDGTLIKFPWIPMLRAEAYSIPMMAITA